MPRNGSGTDITPAGQPVAAGTVIDSTIFNAMVTDVYNEITNSIARDGQAPATANIPLGNFKLTGVGTPTLTQDATNKTYVDGLIATATTASTAAGAVGRNKIINGDMRIDQRNNGSSVTITAAAALQYVVDRWYAYCTGANVTATRSIFSLANYDFVFTGAVGVTGCGLGQRIESGNARGLVGGNATLSVLMSNSLLATASWGAYYANTTDAFGTLGAPTRTLIASGTFTGLTAAQSTVSATMAIPLAAATGIEIVISVGAQVSGTWTVSNVQLKPGLVNSEFDYQNYATELARCQRYYQSVRNYSQFGLAPVTGQAVSAVRIIGGGVIFPVVMRATPAVNVYSPNADDAVGNVALYNSIAVSLGTAFALSGGKQGLNSAVTGNAFSALTIGNYYSYAYDADAEL